MKSKSQKAAEHLSSEAGDRLSDIGEMIVHEAAEIADRLSAWISGSEAVGHAKDTATDSIDTVREWSSALPQRLASALPVVATVPAKPKKRTIVGAVAVGAGLSYYFDPTSGSARRTALKQKISGLIGRKSEPVG